MPVLPYGHHPGPFAPFSALTRLAVSAASDGNEPMAWNTLPFGMIQRISPSGPAAAVLARPFPRRAFRARLRFRALLSRPFALSSRSGPLRSGSGDAPAVPRVTTAPRPSWFVAAAVNAQPDLVHGRDPPTCSSAFATDGRSPGVLRQERTASRRAGQRRESRTAPPSRSWPWLAEDVDRGADCAMAADDDVRDHARPARLVRGTEPGAVVAVEVLVEDQVVSPLRVLL